MKTITHNGNEIHLLGPMSDMLKLLAAMHQPGSADEQMALVIGAQGMGKTTASRLFAEQHRDVVYIDMLPSVALQSAGSVPALIERSMGLEPRKLTISERLYRICDDLRRQRRLLILDTAHRMVYRHIDVFRYIHDHARVPVVFMGVPALKPEFDRHLELQGRLRFSIELRPPTREEIVDLMPELPAATWDDIYRRTQGRMREVLQFLRLIRSSNREPKRWQPGDVEKVVRTLRAA